MAAPLAAAAAATARAVAGKAALQAVTASVKSLKLAKRPRVTHWVPEYTKEIELEYKRRTKRAAEVIRDRIRQNIGRPYGGTASKEGEYPKKRSGKMQKGVKTRLGRRSPYTFTVYNTEDYADHLEYDTKGGKVIVPVAKKVLAWQGSGKGAKTIFAKRVVQGPIKGRSFMRRTLAESRGVIAAIYTRGLKVKQKGTLRIG